MLLRSNCWRSNCWRSDCWPWRPAGLLDCWTAGPGGLLALKALEAVEAEVLVGLVLELESHQECWRNSGKCFHPFDWVGVELLLQLLALLV